MFSKTAAKLARVGPEVGIVSPQQPITVVITLDPGTGKSVLTVDPQGSMDLFGVIALLVHHVGLANSTAKEITLQRMKSDGSKETL